MKLHSKPTVFEVLFILFGTRVSVLGIEMRPWGHEIPFPGILSL